MISVYSALCLSIIKFHLGIINLSKRDVYFPMPENDILLCKISPCEIYFC